MMIKIFIVNLSYLLKSLRVNLFNNTQLDNNFPEFPEESKAFDTVTKIKI